MNISAIPKVELHCHLDCALRVETVFEIAKDLKLDLPLQDFEAFKKAVLVKEPMKDLKTVLQKFLTAQKVLHSEDVLERMAFEATEDAFHQNIKLIEYRYSPSFIRSGHEHLNFESIHQAILKGIKKAKSQYDIEVGLIGIIGRNDPLELATEVCEFITANKDTFIGIDLADNEQDFDCRPFAPLFQKAKSEGLHITVHAGEAIYPRSCQSVIDAIEMLGAERIGHGIQIINDESVLKKVVDANVTLEVCPTSNWLTQSVPDIKEHPIRKLIDKGVKVTINTDDPGIFDYNLNHEYEVLYKNFGFTEEDFKACNRHALEASFLKPKQNVSSFFS